MTECAGVEPEPVETEETEEPAPEEAEPETGGNMGMLLLVLAVAVIGGGAGWYFFTARNTKKPPSPRRTMAGSWTAMTAGNPTGTRRMTARPGTRRTMTERRLTNEVYRQPL